MDIEFKDYLEIVLASYKKEYEEIKDIQDAILFKTEILSRRMHRGICFYAHARWGFLLFRDEIKGYSDNSGYWFPLPSEARTIKEAKERIEKRIALLSKIIEDAAPAES